MGDVLSNEELTLRRARPDDSDFFFELRNEEDVRNASMNSDPIDTASHRRWFEDQLHSGNLLLVAEVTEDSLTRPVGYARFEPVPGKEGTAAISVALSPAFRGRRLGSKLIATATEAAFGSGIDRVVARIKDSNRPSLGAFARAGFDDSGREDRNGENVIVMERSRAK